MNEYYEILCKKQDFYKVKNSIEKKISNLLYSGIEWKPINTVNLSTDQKKEVINMLESLEENDDIQNIFINCKF